MTKDIFSNKTKIRFGSQTSAEDLYSLGGKYSFLSYETLIKLLKPENFYKSIKSKQELIQFINALNHSYCAKNNIYGAVVMENEFNKSVTAFYEEHGNTIYFNKHYLNLFDSMKESRNVFFPSLIFENIIHETEHSVQIFDGQSKCQVESLKYDLINATSKIDQFLAMEFHINCDKYVSGFGDETFTSKDITSTRAYMQSIYFGSPTEIGAREKALQELSKAIKTDPSNKNFLNHLILSVYNEIDTSKFNYYISKQLERISKSNLGTDLLMREITFLEKHVKNEYNKINLKQDEHSAKLLNFLINSDTRNLSNNDLFFINKYEKNLEDVYKAELKSSQGPFKTREGIIHNVSLICSANRKSMENSKAADDFFQNQNDFFNELKL